MDILGNFPETELKRQLEFLVEIDKVKNILRQTLLTDGSRQENDAEHSWHIAVMAVILEKQAPKNVDINRAVKMCLIHDLIEIYAGDTFAYDTEANKGKEEREKAAGDRLFSILPKEQGEELKKLWMEFDAMETQDAKYAASLDRLQPFIHNVLTNGHTWNLGKVTRSQVEKRISVARETLPALRPWIDSMIELGVEKGWIKS